MLLVAPGPHCGTCSTLTELHMCCCCGGWKLCILWCSCGFFRLRHPPSPLCPGTGLRPEEEDGERGDMAFLKDLLSPGPGTSDEFSREWQDAFGIFEPPSVTAPAAGTAGSGPAARPPSPRPSGFLPSQLLDHSLSSTGQSRGPLLER